MRWQHRQRLAPQHRNQPRDRLHPRAPSGTQRQEAPADHQIERRVRLPGPVQGLQIFVGSVDVTSVLAVDHDPASDGRLGRPVVETFDGPSEQPMIQPEPAVDERHQLSPRGSHGVVQALHQSEPRVGPALFRQERQLFGSVSYPQRLPVGERLGEELLPQLPHPRRDDRVDHHRHLGDLVEVTPAGRPVEAVGDLGGEEPLVEPAGFAPPAGGPGVGLGLVVHGGQVVGHEPAPRHVQPPTQLGVFPAPPVEILAESADFEEPGAAHREVGGHQGAVGLPAPNQTGGPSTQDASEVGLPVLLHRRVVGSQHSPSNQFGVRQQIRGRHVGGVDVVAGADDHHRLVEVVPAGVAPHEVGVGYAVGVDEHQDVGRRRPGPQVPGLPGPVAVSLPAEDFDSQVSPHLRHGRCHVFGGAVVHHPNVEQLVGVGLHPEGSQGEPQEVGSVVDGYHDRDP